MKRLVIVLAVLLVTILASLFVVPSLIDWNGYRSEIERQVAQTIGRKVRVGGDVSLRLLPTPYLQVSDIRIADDDGRFARPFAKIGGLAVRLAVPPLLQGDIVAEEVVIDQPEVTVAFDAQGRASWHDIGANAAGLPRTVSLASVKIERGSIALMAEDGVPLTSLNAINGELTAPSLSGPYKFRGSYAQGGTRHDVRVSTGSLSPGSLKAGEQPSEPAAEGVRLRVATGPENGGRNDAQLVFDGVMRDATGAARLTGTLTGKAAPPAGSASAEPLDFTASLDADAKGARLLDVVVTVPGGTSDAAGAGAVARSSELRGNAQVDWGKKPGWSAEMAGPWLDLDRLLPAAASGAAAPSVSLDQRLQDALSPLLGILPGATRFDVALRLEEAGLGGGSLERLAVKLKRDGGVLGLEDFTVTLPGQSRLEASGRLATVVDGSGEPPRLELDFAGPVHISGSSLDKFIAWSQALVTAPVTGAAPAAAPGPDRPFLAHGQVEWAAKGLSLDNVRAEISGASLVGHWRRKAQQLDVALDTDDLDLRGLWTPPATLATGLDWAVEMVRTAEAGMLAAGPDGASPAGGNTGTSAEPVAGASPAAITGTRLDLRLGRVRTASGEARDVVLKAETSPEGLRITTLTGTSGEGLSVTGDGLLTRDAPGPLKFSLVAQTEAALLQLRRFTETTFDPGDGTAWGPLLPLRLAGQVGAPDSAGGMDVTLAGTAGSSQLSLRWRGDALSKAAGPPGAGLDDVTIVLTNSDAAALRRQLAAVAGRDLAGAAAVPVSPPAVATLRLSGARTGTLRILADLSAGSEQIAFNGTTRLSGDSAGGWQGQLEGRGADAGFWAAALGSPALAAAPDVSLSADLTGTGRRLTSAAGNFGLGDRKGSFELTVAPAIVAGQPPAITADIRTDRADAAALASLLVRPVASTTPAAAGELAVRDLGLEASGSVWSDRPIDLAGLGFTGTVRLQADVLTLPGVSAGSFSAMGNALLEASVAPGSVELKQIAADLAGGRVTASASLRRLEGRTALDFSGKLQGARLEAVAHAGEGAAQPVSGPLSLELSGASTARTPRGLAALLTGKGKADVGDVAVTHLNPSRIDAAARMILLGQARLNPDSLQRLILRGRPGEKPPEGEVPRFTAAAASIPLTIEGGIVTLGPVTADAESATLTVTASLDVQRMTTEALWRVAPKSGGDGPALTPVTYTYAGPAALFSELTPVSPAAVLDAAGLEEDLRARRTIGPPGMFLGLWPDPNAPELPPAATDQTGALDNSTAIGTGELPAGTP